MYKRRKNKTSAFDDDQEGGSKESVPFMQQHQQLKSNDRNNMFVHPVWLVLLKLVITLAMAAVIGTFVFPQGFSHNQPPPPLISSQEVQLRGQLGPKLLNNQKNLKEPQHMDMEVHLDDLLNSIPATTAATTTDGGGIVQKRLVDLGAAVRDNDPCFSLIDKGWSALLVDGDNTQPAKWKDRFPTGDYTGVVSYILADGIVELLTHHGFDKDIGLLKIDIDSFDCYVMQAILKAGIRPRAIVMEVNVKFPPHVRFAMQPGFTRVEDGNDESSSTTTASASSSSSSSSWKQIPFDSEKRGHIYGCSLGYQVEDVMHPNDYEIYYMDWNNVMYVDTRDMSPKTKETLVKGGDTKEWYDYGYWNRRERNKAFGFNKPISYWYEMDAGGLMKEIQNKFMPLVSHANHHIQWNGDSYCFDQEGNLLSAAENDGSKCSLTKTKQI